MPCAPRWPPGRSGYYLTGPVAAFRRVTVVPALPKTRSGKILRRTMRGLVEGRDEPVPATIDDASTLAVFRGLGAGD